MLISVFTGSVLLSEPSFNGTTPGCSGGGCHDFKSDLVSAEASDNFQIEVTLSGIGSGEKVGGELMDNSGNIVDLVNSTTSNPFILTASTAVTYLVNAGSKKPTRSWDSVSVNLTITGIDQPLSDNGPASYRLFNNYPNPFNPLTTIKYALPEAAKVRITVRNVLGEIEAVLLDDYRSRGDHTVVLDGNTLASGIYFYSIKTASFRQTKKMILIK
jgi:hypothetical protein